jgi:hypothetical protein
MQSKATSPKEYFDQLPKERQAPMKLLRAGILQNIPKGFSEEMSYGMIGYVVPHSLYSKGYHCNPKLPLPFMAIASQKNFIALYHMGIYGDEKLLEWFKKEYAKFSTAKLDMGKGCMRFKKPEAIPYNLIGELAGKISVDEWIRRYEKNRETR